MGSSSLPLYPSDDGWPYPDTLGAELESDDEVDLDALELRIDPHAYADLTEREHFAVFHRFGLDGDACSMLELARAMDCTDAEAAVVLSAAIDKLRDRLTST